MSEPNAAETRAVDVRTDDGLSRALANVTRARSWEVPTGLLVLEEVRRRAVRVAAHVSSKTGARCDRSLVDDVVVAAWTVLSTQTDQVVAAESRWAYLMSAAGRAVLAEAWGQRYLTSATRARGEARRWMPRHVDPVGVAAADLEQAMPQPEIVATASLREDSLDRVAWLDGFVQVLVAAGAARSMTEAAVDRMSELLPRWPNRWETTARQDPVLADLGLSPDQASALVALLAGSRRSGRTDGLLAAVRESLNTGAPLRMTFEQRRRIRTFASTGPAATATPVPHVRVDAAASRGAQLALFDGPTRNNSLAS